MEFRPHAFPASASEQDAMSDDQPSDPYEVRDLATLVRRAVARGRESVLARQLPEGCWPAKLDFDVLPESETILVWAMLSRERSETVARLADHVARKHVQEGCCSAQSAATTCATRCVLNYFALKIAGYHPSDEPMRRARLAALRAGGIDAVEGPARFYLAMLGQIPYDECPVALPEVVFWPGLAPAELTNVDLQPLRTLVPLSILSSTRPIRELPISRGVRELFVHGEREDLPADSAANWLPHMADAAKRLYGRLPLAPTRQLAIRRARRWMNNWIDRSEGRGANFRPTLWCILAMRSLGVAEDDPRMTECIRRVESQLIEDDEPEALCIRPTYRPIRETSIAVEALAAAGIGPENPAMQRAVDWLLKAELRAGDDWAATDRVEPGGWRGRHDDGFRPDVEDTAAAIRALTDQFDTPAAEPRAQSEPEHEDAPAEHQPALPPDLYLVTESSFASMKDAARHLARIEDIIASVQRGDQWLSSMRSDPVLLEEVGQSGQVLQCLGRLGRSRGEPVVDRHIAHLKQTQQPDGCWDTQVDDESIRETAQAILGLAAVGVPEDHPVVAAGVNWLMTHYDRPHHYAEPTATETAWVILGLMAADKYTDRTVILGIHRLLEAREGNSQWRDTDQLQEAPQDQTPTNDLEIPLMALSRWLIGAAPKVAEQHTPTLRIITDLD